MNFKVKVHDSLEKQKKLLSLITENRANILFITQSMYNVELG